MMLSTYLSMSYLYNVLFISVYIIGLLAIVVFLYDNLKSPLSIIKAHLEPYFQPQAAHTLLDKFGKWAVVTGSTDGIGREYAKELAKKGLNLVLISRSKEKLLNVAQDIESSFNVKTKCIVVDFSLGSEIYKHIQQELMGITVGILVNNVGVNCPYPDELSHHTADTVWQLINVNIGAMTLMSHMVIPLMKKQGKGAIINISSGCELQPIPYVAVYAATKRYIRSLSVAMEYELAQYNITVQTLTPFFVVTKMNQFSETIMKGNPLIPTPEIYAQSAVHTLGKSSETTGYWLHGIQYCVTKLLPETLRIRLAQFIAEQFKKEYAASQARKKIF